jgi:hypothetical protein
MHGNVPFPVSSLKMSQFLLIRSRWVLKSLRALKTDTATGPDGLPVRVFKECALPLSVAIAILIRFILRTACWPQTWRLHHIHPLFKKGQAANQAIIEAFI